MGLWNFIYLLIVGYCVMFGLTWLWFMNYQANEYVRHAIVFEDISLELYEKNLTACAAYYCGTARAFCGNYEVMRGELLVTYQGQDFYKESRESHDTFCGINGSVGKRCFPILMEYYYGE